LSPEVAFTGDTMSDFIVEPRNADALRAKVLITEVLLSFSRMKAIYHTRHLISANREFTYCTVPLMEDYSIFFAKSHGALVDL